MFGSLGEGGAPSFAEAGFQPVKLCLVGFLGQLRWYWEMGRGVSEARTYLGMAKLSPELSAAMLVRGIDLWGETGESVG